MPKNAKYVPKHKAAKHRAVPAPVLGRTAVRTTLALSTIATGVTGLSIAGGVLGSPQSPSLKAESADLSAAVSRSLSQDAADRSVVSRDSSRSTTGSTAATSGAESTSTESAGTESTSTVDPAKAAALSQTSGGVLARTEKLDTSDPKAIAQALLPEFGFSSDQFGCLDSLWTRESGWRVNADNPSSSAYGIPQALPGSKMSSAGADWATNPETQIRWGLGYIRDRYGSPCGAWSHSEAQGFY